jgi:hypothetical protein
VANEFCAVQFPANSHRAAPHDKLGTVRLLVARRRLAVELAATESIMIGFAFRYVFSAAELTQLAPHTCLTKSHGGRTVTLVVSPGHGSFLTVTGAAVPNDSLCVGCDGDTVNAVARCLLTGQFQ